MKKIVLIGAGGHGSVVCDTLLRLKEYRVAGFVDNSRAPGETVLGVPVLGTDRELGRIFRSGVKLCLVTVGSTGAPSARERLVKLAEKAGFSFPVVIAPSAVVSPFASIGEGSFVAPGCVINANARIGRHCIVNTLASIDHDCRIGDFVHVAPGCALSGTVAVGSRSHIGTGTAISHGIRIGKDTVIGAGSAVVKDIGDGCVAYGNPCRKVRKA